MLNRRGFLKGIFGAVALIAAAPALRVADAVLPGPPPPKPKVPSHEQKAFVVARYQTVIKAVPTEGLPPGTMLCDGRFLPKGTYRELELALSRNDAFPYGETHRLYRLPDVRGAA